MVQPVSEWVSMDAQIVCAAHTHGQTASDGGRLKTLSLTSTNRSLAPEPSPFHDTNTLQDCLAALSRPLSLSSLAARVMCAVGVMHVMHPFIHSSSAVSCCFFFFFFLTFFSGSSAAAAAPAASPSSAACASSSFRFFFFFLAPSSSSGTSAGGSSSSSSIASSSFFFFFLFFSSFCGCASSPLTAPSPAAAAAAAAAGAISASALSSSFISSLIAAAPVSLGSLAASSPFSHDSGVCSLGFPCLSNLPARMSFFFSAALGP
mmetsp:Transcript_2655/g.6019  ORF Transcript_2655/g.6019 Transcript_2655/m.6019 type:complete len:262 (+) Transcript_2655:194-979(+)